MKQPNLVMDRMISAPDSNEYVNTISHGLGALGAVAVTALLVTLAARDGNGALVVGFAVYGTTLLLSFLASSLLHFFLLFGRYQRVLGILDHSAIYLLIAGTYTPFCLTLFAGARGWVLLGIVWGLAIFWIVIKAVWFVRLSSLVSNLSYLSLGWIVLCFIAPISAQLGVGAVGLMLTAGLVYTLGAVSFQYGRPNPFPPYFGNHELWHMAVLIGGGLLFCVMFFYVLPYPA
ncbi:MAG TPA: hemolysin III family protein [Herpetosiphonaceae bacterium]